MSGPALADFIQFVWLFLFIFILLFSTFFFLLFDAFFFNVPIFLEYARNTVIFAYVATHVK